MAFSLHPLKFSSPTSPSQSLYFIKTHYSLQSFRAQKLKICCCQQTVQLGNEKTNFTKKKRRPRPSFLEQIQDKWSLKNPSLRQTFPWEEEEGNSNVTVQVVQDSEDVLSEIESGKNGSLSDSISSDVGVKSTLPPWVHGKEPRKKHFDSVEKQENYTEKDLSNKVIDAIPVELPDKEEILSDGVSKDSILIEDREVLGDGESKDSVFIEDKEVLGDGESKDSVFIEDREVLGDGESKDSIFTEDSPRKYREYGNSGYSGDASVKTRLPWKRVTDEGFGVGDKLRRSNTELAERLIPEFELNRLRNVALRMVERIKVGAAGVTQQLVDEIHEKWRNEEVVKFKFEGPPSKNMKRIHEVLESRTGGLVIFRSGTSVVLYRGMTYKLDCVKSYTEHIQADSVTSGSSEDLVEDFSRSIRTEHPGGAKESSRPYKSNYLNNLSEEEQMDLNELNLVLDELGPRFIDWSGREPLPVDADLLPAVVPGYKTPFRLLPYETRQTLHDKEMTYLRRTARTMPPHFALGRNRELQGLAAAILKLWEKSAIVKIAIKRGVHNTSNERMAEELKILTGGTLLSRNKEYIVFYRGNDFLPPNISTVLKEVEKSTAVQQDEEEQARHRAAMLIDKHAKAHKQPLVAGTLAETLAATSRWANQPDNAEIEKMKRERAIASHDLLIKTLQRKLALAKGKIGLAEKAVVKLQGDREAADLPTDLETLTDEERFLFRKIGLSMKPYLVLGRREIFGGTIENMHLHWKYRELVKIIVERKTFAQVKHIAISLEAESGGVLVSVDKTMKGHVIIVYRGKNYQRPSAFRPNNLLTKRQALARSIELQRREALKHHVVELEEKLGKLKDELEDMEAANEKD